MFSQTFANHAPRGPFVVLSEVGSTNNYAMAKLHAGMVVPGICFLALNQTAGKGQRGRSWLAEPGLNITMSTVLQCHVHFPFIYSAAVALACFDFFGDAGIKNLSIKWPNDLYIGDRKAAGILLENTYRGATPLWSVAGTGVNLNQTEFPRGTRATSLAIASGRMYDLRHMGLKLHQHILSRHEWASTSVPEAVMEEYNSRLYLRDQRVKLKKGAVVFETTIRRVTLSGELVTSDSIERSFCVGEVEFKR